MCVRVNGDKNWYMMYLFRIYRWKKKKKKGEEIEGSFSELNNTCPRPFQCNNNNIFWLSIAYIQI